MLKSISRKDVFLSMIQWFNSYSNDLSEVVNIWPHISILNMTSHDKVYFIDIEPVFSEPSHGRAYWEKCHYVYVAFSQRESNKSFSSNTRSAMLTYNFDWISIV